MAYVHDEILAAAERCERAAFLADSYRSTGEVEDAEVWARFAANDSATAFRLSRDIPTGDHWA